MIEPSAQLRYALTLFVTGATPRSMRAIANLRRFCEAELTNLYDLEIVDLYAQPERAEDDAIVASPTLVRRRPEPKRYAIGDMSDSIALRRLFGGH